MQSPQPGSFDSARSTQIVEHIVNHGFTALEFGRIDEFVGLMSLVDGLVRPNQLHGCRFTDDGEVRSREVGQRVIYHAIDTKAANVLIGIVLSAPAKPNAPLWVD